LDRLAAQEVDGVWFRSVWQTGLAVPQVSRHNPEWRKAFPDTLPDLQRNYGNPATQEAMLGALLKTLNF
jgi:hypothetical protein